MAPVRRYLRITQHSVLETRIYLDNPSLAASWLLNPRDPILPRIITAIRPLVLPKLREENERAATKKGSKKKKGVKDVVVEDDFEVAVFLVESGSRHALLFKRKEYAVKNEAMKSNSSKLADAGADADRPIELNDEIPTILREEDEEDANVLAQIPTADVVDAGSDDDLEINTRKRHRRESDALFVADGDVTPKRMRVESEDDVDEVRQDDKKKLAISTTYEGFTIYGKILCLVVKKKNVRARPAQAMMEDWITSTQMPPEDIT